MIPEFSGDIVQWLRGFYHVAVSGSVSQAAVLMGRRQPAVSYHIKSLEESLGVELFDRSHGRMTLTGAGQRLLEKTVDLFEVLKEIEGEAARPGGDLRGRVSLVTTHAVILYLLPNIVVRFNRTWPLVRAEISGGGLKTILDRVSLAEVDFGIASLTDIPDNLSYEPLFSTGLCLLAPREWNLPGPDEITPADIAARPFIAFPQTSTIRSQVNRVFAGLGLELNVVHVLNHFELVKKFVEVGLGVAIVDGYAITAEDRKRLRVIPLAGPFPRRTYGVITTRRKYISRPVTRFLDLLREMTAGLGRE